MTVEVFLSVSREYFARVHHCTLDSCVCRGRERKREEGEVEEKAHSSNYFTIERIKFHFRP